MPKPLHIHLSRRESQIMDVVYRLGEVTVADVVDHIADTPSYNSVRVTLGKLERKGYVRHRREQRRYYYSPALSSENVTHSATRHLLKTFFGGSPSRAILTLLDISSPRLSKDELTEIMSWIEKAKDEVD